MLKYGYGKYPNKREKPQKDKKVTFETLSGRRKPDPRYHLTIAFEITDAFGNPLEASRKDHQ